MKAGKLDMDTKDLVENVETCIKAITETLNKPYEQAIKKLYLAPTMGASVKISYIKN
jgi:ribosomal protein L1